MSFNRATVSGGILRAITPSDTVLVRHCKALWSNAGGAITLQFPNGKGGFEATVAVTLPAGTPVPVESPFRLMATGTTAAVLGFFEPTY